MAINTTPINHTSDYECLCNDAKTRVKEISPAQTKELLDGNEKFFLIDVRDGEEFSAYRIEGATFISKGWIEAKIHTVVPDKNDKIVLYCGGGNRSALAGDNLQRMGYTNIYSMRGGIKGWVNEGFEVIE